MTAALGAAQKCLGKIYEAPDTVHDTGKPIKLLVVQNETGGDITVARKFGSFRATTAKDFGRIIGAFPNTTAGGVAVALDDKYTVGTTILEHDLFYVVLEGPCNVLTAAAVNSLAANIGVVSDNAGLIANKAAPAAGEFPVGALDYLATYVASTATRVYMANPLRAVPAAG
jgi:hypothetical protein